MKIEFDMTNAVSEHVAYNEAEFPLYIRKGILSLYPSYSAISHWHDDIELIYINSGEMHYNINGEHIILHEGEGLFLNTKQIHYGYSPDHKECIFICILFHPRLLCSVNYMEQQFIVPVLENINFPYLILHQTSPAENDIINCTKELLNLSDTDNFALKSQTLIFRIWENIFELSGHTPKIQFSANHHLTLLKDMIRYIENHYSNKISLEEICSVGGVSKTTCSHIFLKYTNQTPISYLTEFRLKKALKLLQTTDKTIAEIGYEVGFSSASYFAETFKKTYNCSPKYMQIRS